MFQHSWFYRNGLFYTILAAVLLVHLLLLAMRMIKDVDLVDASLEGKDAPKTLLLVTLKKQVVQSEDPINKYKLKNKSYLSDKDRAFDRQSVARNIDTFKSAGSGGAVKGSVTLSDLGAFEKGHDPLKEAAKKLKSGANRPRDNLNAVSSTNDFIEDVPLGDLTYLNTVEYKYYGFYYRIRQKLEQFWGRSIQEKAESLAKEGRRIASNDNLITSLQITLDENGRIVSISIKGSSGIQELDTAAIESFNAAGPFPNPPKGLIENGRVNIEWGFVVKT
jgi:TonB family protein